MGDKKSRQREELEVKFYISSLEAIENRLQMGGAVLIQPRCYEKNLLFDNAAGDLARQSQILRLRADQQARLTFKGRGRESDQAYARLEIELTVSSFEAAETLLQALGYQVSWVYEKYRTVYDLKGVAVTLDEMPFGHFIEVEGPAGERIREVSAALGLDWERRILSNYRELFERVRLNLDQPLRDLTFADFGEVTVLPETLGVQPAEL